MTVRTIKQAGVAFGAQTANITAKINDVVVYQGPVTTLDEAVPVLPNLSYQVTNDLFSWTVPDVSFTGLQTLEITNDNNATLLVAGLTQNYTPVPNDPVANVPPSTHSSGPDGYIGLVPAQFGNTYVNGVLQSVTHTTETEGQWWWTIPPGGTFIENMTIEPGQE